MYIKIKPNINNKQTKQMFTRKIRSTALLLAIAIIPFSGVLAQATTPLSLKEALNYALENYSEARKAKLDIENAGYQIQEVRSRALPQVNGNGGLNYNPLLQMSALPGELNAADPGKTLLVAFGQKWNTNIGVSVSQNIFDMSVFTGLKAAKSTREFYQLNAQLTEEKALETVATTYYQVLIQQQHIVNIDSNISTTEKTQKIIQGLYESGLGKKIDVDRLEVKLLNLQSQRRQLMNAVSQFENQLKFFIGMPVEQQITIVSEDHSNLNFSDALIEENADSITRSELLVLEKQQQLLQLKKQSVKAEYYPTLALSGSYSYQGLGNTFPIFKGIDKGANWFDVATVGLNLRIPLFNGNATRARVNQAEVDIKKLQEDISQTKQSINLDFENAKKQISNSIIVLNTQEKNTELAENVLDNTSNNYKQGLATLTDLLDAQNALFEARNAYNSSLLDYRLAEVKLTKAKGQLRTLLN